MDIQVLCLPPLGTNCYLIKDNENVTIVDPGSSANMIIKTIEHEKFRPKAILLTHGHFDHAGAAGTLKEHYSIPIYIHHEDAPMLENAETSHALRFGFPYEGCEADYLLKEGDSFFLGETVLTVLHTPGHTPGSICFLSKNTLLSGDMLFYGSIGRFDPENKAEMKSSLQRLLTLEDSIKVYPGHDRETTIGRERRMNPFANFNWEWE